MKTRKILSAALASAMVVAMSVPAFAAEDTPTNTELDTLTNLSASTEVTGGIQTPTIKITIPSTGAVMVNPYKMEYKADPDGDGVSDQIISAVQSVKSSSNIALNVTATVSGKIPTGSKAVFSPTSTVNPAKPITTKSVYMYLQTELNASDETGAFGNEFDGTKDIVVGTKAASLKVGSLAAGTEDAPSILNYRLTGDAVEAPAIAWNGEDKVNVTVAFTFAPVAVEESAGA